MAGMTREDVKVVKGDPEWIRRVVHKKTEVIVARIERDEWAGTVRWEVLEIQGQPVKGWAWDCDTLSEAIRRVLKQVNGEIR